MKRYLLTLLALAAFSLLSYGQIIYEDFEGGASLNWQPFGDGVFNGVVPNPPDQDPLGINPSDECGSYTKSGQHAFSLFIAVLDEPMDLSVNNQFRIQINAPVTTRFIFKLEGAGQAIEGARNIGVANNWIEYTFDFSAAASFTTIDKILIFFDYGVEESSDTYLFDNIVAYPAGACAGTVPNPLILDDFECQRNVTYGVPGFTDVTVVDNPDASGINTSAKVGRYLDPPGPWAALVYDYNSPADFPITREGSSVVKIKVWAPVAGNLLFKLEGGGSPVSEKPVQITQLNQWVEYKVDFSDQIGASHRKLVFFFNAGVDSGPEDVYYIDDLALEAAPSGSILEDFEPQQLAWQSLGATAVFGTFDGVVANPAPNAVNNSSNVGRYTKGSSQFGGLRAQLPTGFALGQFPQLDLHVWAPSGTNSFTMRLFSPTQGLQSVKVNLPATGEWVALNFNFVDFVSITDFERVELVFDEDLASSGTWYFDNLSQGVSTVDPCEGVEPIVGIVDDFDCQRNVPITGGADRLTVINNPDPSGINPNPLDKVGEYRDPLDEWSALVYNYGVPIDLSIRNQLNIKIWAPGIVPLLFKLEGGTNPAQVEIFTNVTTANQWVQYVIDFSGYENSDFTRLAIFFNAGQLPSGETLYYIDDIEWRRSPYTGCISDFESPDFTVDNWRYFANGSLEGTEFEVVANPNQDAVNSSENVGIFLKAPDGAVFAGMFASLAAPVTLPTNNKTIRMKVLGPVAGQMVFKLEGGQAGAPNSGDVFADYTTANSWQELVWDFSVLPDNALHGVITFIPNFGEVPAAVQTFYFDDIVIADAQCITTGLSQAPSIKALKAFPNPVQDILNVENTEELSHFVVFNAMGQRLSIVQVLGQPVASIDVAHLQPGMYVLAGYNRQGALVANARFVKQ
jgi:hypothetical protein